MCAIVDASVVGKVFNPNRSGAAEKFYNWISTGEGRLVVGGKVLYELDKNSNFKMWRREAIRAGKVKTIKASLINEKMKNFRDQKLTYESNDPHVLALAQASGARLLYSDDGDLQQDFKNGKLIKNPRGTVYSTREREDFTGSHRDTLKRGRELCRNF